MKVLICDRCKKMYDKNNNPKYKVNKISSTASRYPKVIDLCPECEESLAEWFKEGKNESK